MTARPLALWGPFLLALAFGFTLSSMPSVPGTEYVWDKILHVIEFTGLGLLGLRAFHGGLARPRLGPTVAAGIVVVLWGASDEFHQSFVPGRDASVRDLAADVVGFGVAVVAAFAIARLRGRRAAL